MKRTTVRIEYDESPSSPRKDDNIGVLVIYDRYGLKFDGGMGSEYRHGEVRNHDGYNTSALPHQYMRGIKVEARTDLNDLRSSCRGFIYITPQAAIEAWPNETSAARRAHAQACADAEADAYQAWAEGNVFGYVVEVRTLCELCEALDAEDVPDECPHCNVDDYDSCWGFITANPETDLLEAMGDYMGTVARSALVKALASGDYLAYPHYAVATVEGSDDA